MHLPRFSFCVGGKGGGRGAAKMARAARSSGLRARGATAWLARMAPEAIVGIDGGGTKTEARAALLRPDGSADPIDGLVRVGATNLHSETREAVQHELRVLRDEVLRLLPAGATVRAVVLGAAGVDRPDEQRLLEKMLGGLFPDARLLVVNDAVTAMAGALGHLGGVVVIAGTGSIALGACGLGRIERAGGWGHLLGDEGGGYQLGLAALRAICRSHDGRAPETAMARPILEALGLGAAPDLLGWLARPETGKTEIASVTPHVFAAAEAGDAAARAICREQAQALVELVVTARRKLPQPADERLPLAMVGGNLRNALYRELFLAGLAASGAPLVAVEAQAGPTEGGLHLAQSLLNEDPGAADELL